MARIVRKKQPISGEFMALIQETNAKHTNEVNQLVQRYGRDMLERHQKEREHYITTHKENVGIPPEAIVVNDNWEWDASEEE